MREITKSILIAIAFVLAIDAGQCFARDRIALVIGNADYQSKPLRNPVNDARDIASALKKVGFNVRLVTNGTQQQMESEIQDFGRKLNRESIGLFYFSGHGVQYEGANYLIPIDSMSRITAPDHLRYKAVDAGYILSVMKQSGSGLNLVFLDACRDNFFNGFSRSLSKGLARISGAEGTLIAYATSPGKVALDGVGRNSPYTESLVSLIETSNAPIELMLKEVRSRVKSKTNDKQSPWYEASIDGDFFFSQNVISSISQEPITPTSESSTSAYNKIEIIDKGKIYSTLSDNCAPRPSKEIGALSRSSGWGHYYPNNGDVGELIQKLQHCNQGEIYLIKVGKYYVPIAKEGIKFVR